MGKLYPIALRKALASIIVAEDNFFLPIYSKQGESATKTQGVTRSEIEWENWKPNTKQKTSIPVQKIEKVCVNICILKEVRNSMMQICHIHFHTSW